MLGIICQVSGKATPVMTSFAASMGLDAPTEVVNVTELDFLMEQQVPMIAINCGVGLSVAIPGVAASVAAGVLGSLPIGCPGVVGVRDMEQARQAHLDGASAVLIKAEMLAATCDDAARCTALVDDLKYVVSGDD